MNRTRRCWSSECVAEYRPWHAYNVGGDGARARDTRRDFEGTVYTAGWFNWHRLLPYLHLECVSVASRLGIQMGDGCDRYPLPGPDGDIRR